MAETTKKTETRVSHVTVGIKRLLNTAQYENIEVKLETTEEVSWDSMDERNMKINNIRKLLTQQFQDTQSAVLADLGIEEKRAWRKPQTVKTSTLASTLGDEILGSEK